MAFLIAMVLNLRVLLGATTVVSCKSCVRGTLSEFHRWMALAIVFWAHAKKPSAALLLNIMSKTLLQLLTRLLTTVSYPAASALMIFYRVGQRFLSLMGRAK